MVRLWDRFWKIRIFNFMVVGGLGALIGTLLIYWPITILIHNRVTVLGQIFYLPGLIPSSIVSMTFNYYMNNKWTYRGCSARQLSLLRYYVMGSTTWIFDMMLLVIFVRYCHIYYLLALLIATIVMFLVRYVISGKWIWRVAKT